MAKLATIENSMECLFKHGVKERSGESFKQEFDAAYSKGEIEAIKLLREWGKESFTLPQIKAFVKNYVMYKPRLTQLRYVFPVPEEVVGTFFGNDSGITELEGKLREHDLVIDSEIDRTILREVLVVLKEDSLDAKQFVAKTLRKAMDKTVLNT